MAPRSKPPKAPKVRAEKRPKQTDDYRHAESRANIPEAGLQSFDRKVPKKVRYEYDPHLDPQLMWASKAEHMSFEVDTVSLHMHERISTQAILKTIQKEPAQRKLFGDPELPLDRAVQFYEHGVNWSNRLVLGDSLLVMNSLLHREMMAGKVQVVYCDPPYGVSYDSNFQSRVDKRDVVDGRGESLTREPEQIRAYRDTWTLGTHSYLTYLRDRLLMFHALLGQSGSVFVQINDENQHHVREVLDEVFGPENMCSVIAFRKKTMPLGSEYFERVADQILWYAKDKTKVKTRPLFRKMHVEADALWSWVELADGTRRRMTSEEVASHALLPRGAQVYRLVSLLPAQYRQNQDFEFEFDEQKYRPPRNSCWKTDRDGMEALKRARRLQPAGATLQYILFEKDYPYSRLTAMWDDTGGASEKVYVVQTSGTVVQRCILAATDPGDLVFDPTCGSGTTAYVAEQWGRRWITCDTSRVAVALARQRLMTSTFPYYKLAYPSQGVSGGLVYEEVPHVTLKSIAQNLPSEKEKLYDKPEVVPGVVRVSGPLTVEAINTLDPGESLAFEPVDERARRDDISHRSTNGAPTVNDHLSEMTDLLKRDGGINVPGKGRVEIGGLGRLTSRPGLHAEGSTTLDGKDRRLAVAFGPRYGPVTARLVEEAIQTALGSYEALVIAGFSFDPEVSAFLDKSPPAGLRLFRVQIAPDVLVGDLLKTRHRQNLFSVIGEPDFKVQKKKEGTVVELLGVDIYDPNKNEVVPKTLDDVAAWFVDHDYDGRCFCVCQVFLPVENGKAFEKLQRALKGTVDEEAWEDLRGFVSRPFQPGKHRTIAVKVIDVRGNEVVGVRRLQA